jgi:hypothetical protein
VGGIVYRYNTMVDTNNCRADIRTGSLYATTMESNYHDNSGCMTIHGYQNRIIGNYCRGGSGILIKAGNAPCNQPTAPGNSHVQACDGEVEIESGANQEDLPAIDTRVEAHTGAIHLHLQTGYKNFPTTTVKFKAPVRLKPSDVGPGAIGSAPAAYKAARGL